MNLPGAIAVALNPSRLLAAGLAAVHLASAFLVLLLDVPGWMMAVLIVAILAHGFWAVRRFGWLASPASITGITLHADRQCVLRRRDGGSCMGSIDDSTLVAGWLVVIAVATRGRGRHRAVVCPDMLPADEFRRLRVMLRWGQPAQAPGATEV